MNPADLSLTISPSLTKATPAPLAPTAKNNVPPAKEKIARIDLEPVYTALKAALGDAWPEYKRALSDFVLGALLTACDYHVDKH